MYCVCGKEIKTSHASPWISATMDSSGKVIRGVCQHGIAFDFGEFRIEDKVEILKDAPLMSWKGAQGVVKSKTSSGELGVEIETCCYGKLVVWVKPENLRRVN